MYRYSMSDLASLRHEPQDRLIVRELSGGDYQAFGRLLTIQKTREPVFEPVFDVPGAQERLKKAVTVLSARTTGALSGIHGLLPAKGI